MFKPINVDVIKHPLNWITILLMLVIAGALGHLVLSYFGIEPKDESTEVSDGQKPTKSTVY